MKWKTVAEDYFTFTKAQRRSILIAIGCIAVCLTARFTYRYFFGANIIPADTAFLQEAARLTEPDTSVPVYTKRYPNAYNKEEDEGTYREPQTQFTPKNNAGKGELFPFDPNTLSPEGWKRLGLRDKTIATIQKYLAKGGRFRKPEDIRRIYGLFPDEAERLLPYVKIAATETVTNNTPVERKTITPPATSSTRSHSPALIDINTADTTAFISLPGIGSKLAARMVTFRDKLGGFYAVDQVGETYGLPDSTFQKIKPRLRLGNPVLRKLNINVLSAEDLKANPYIKWNVANAIVQYRQQHGHYATLDDLKKIALIDENLWVKILPYLTVQ